MKIQEIGFEDVLETRQRVLWPNKPKEFCIVQGDDVARHYGIFCEDRLVGVASTYEDSGSVRLRKFAIESPFQGLGLGTALLTYIIGEVRDRGGRRFWCDARENAVQFYSRFGMRPEGERFYKSGVSYFKMSITF